jgi:hypothetical protein
MTLLSAGLNKDIIIIIEISLSGTKVVPITFDSISISSSCAFDLAPIPLFKKSFIPTFN